MSIKNKILILFILISGHIFAQIGGQSSFSSLNFSNSARNEALGGYTLTLYDGDASLGGSNPALINKEHHGQLVLNYVNYFADSDYGFSSYTHHNSKIGTFNFSIYYANYGKFEYADASGIRNGSTFTANDIILQTGIGKQINEKLSIGSNLKLVSSFLESYNSFAIATDFALCYRNIERESAMGLIVKNLGYQIKSYTNNNRERLPFTIDFGISKKLSHAPFRFSFTYHDLQKWNVTYFDVTSMQETDPITGELQELDSPNFIAHFFNHIVIGTELLITENFHLRMGYNFKQRNEMKPEIRPGTTGFSWGLGLKVKKYHISYAISKSYLSATTNHFTIQRKIGGNPNVDGFYRQHTD